jgi:flagellar protein FlaJ
MGFSESYQELSVRLFGKTSQKMIASFYSLKPHLMGANISVLLESFLYIVLFVPIMTASMVFMGFYIYPVQKSAKIRTSIDNGMPFALSHMSAIASSGIPPEFMFELLMGFKEYGEISKQAGIIVRNIKTFGMSSVSAIADVAQRTPSPAFRQVLLGIQSTIEKGGNLTQYLEEMSNRSLFDYRLKRENYLKTLSTYADVYTAVLVSAPLMMIVVLGVMSVIGGDIMGMAAGDLIFLMTWVMIPLMNIIFIAFLHFTYPGN